MINIKYAFFQLSRKVLIYSLIFIQVSISLVLLYASISTKNEVNNTLNRIDRVFKNQSNILAMNSQINNPFNIKIEDYEKFDEYLKNNPKFKHIVINEDNFFIEHFNGDVDFIKTLNKFSNDGIQYSIAYGIDIQYDALNYLNLQVSDGRTFQKSDFSTDYEKDISVLLGNKYSKFFKIGDEINTLYKKKNVKAKVIGFLENNSYAITGKNPGSPISLDNYVVFPYELPTLSDAKLTEDDKIVYLYHDIFDSILVLNNDKPTSNDGIIEEIRRSANNVSINTNVNSVKSNTDDYMESMKESRQFINILFLVVFLFAAIGLVSSILDSLNRRIKEFGVHLMIGASLKNIILRVMYEILIILLFSYIVAITYIYCFQNKYLNFITTIESVVIVMLLFVLLSVIPVIKIMKLNINELVRRNE